MKTGSDFSQAIKRIAKLTDENSHTEALIELAQLMESKYYADILRHIKEIHALEGSLPSKLKEYRHEVYLSLLAYADGQTTDEQYQAIYNAL